MCIGCPDWVDYCDVAGCKGGSPGVSYRGVPSTLRHFYIGDSYCEHLERRYSHPVATGDDQGREAE